MFSMFARRRAPGASNFVRYALMQGLHQQASLGANPFKHGIVASTDTHIAAPGLTEEKGHPGHGGAGMGAGQGAPQGFSDDLPLNPGDLCSAPDFAAQGYAGGVATGGDLLPAPAQGRAAPHFALWAIQDPGSEGAPGTPLQRIQIVKGWIEQGEPRERVIDVATSGGDAGVDLATCERRGAGATSLCSLWTAAGVDCDRPNSVRDGLRGCCSEDHQPVIQERAWTSPIWYTA
jgi:hypothetical protein